jgi:hypothetical protein
MATKTISLRIEAWERLRAAESFSEVILRAQWPGSATSARDYLAACRRQGPTLSPESLRRIEQLDSEDRPPDDKWKS